MQRKRQQQFLTTGKISSLEAYQKIKRAWKELKLSKKGLGIENDPPPTAGE